MAEIVFVLRNWIVYIKCIAADVWTLQHAGIRFVENRVLTGLHLYTPKSAPALWLIVLNVVYAKKISMTNFKILLIVTLVMQGLVSIFCKKNARFQG